MFLSLPFLAKLKIPAIINQALNEAGNTAQPGYSYTSVEVLMTLLLGFLLKCQTFDEIHAKLGGHTNYGVWIGKKRLPCIEIIKSRMQEIATPDFVKKLKHLLANTIAEAGIVDLGVLYIDSHFITYYGKENISKGYSTIRRLALKGVYHHFIGDRQGRPLMFHLTNGSVRLHQVLPKLLKDIQELRTKYDPDRPLFMVFDREIYSAKLFHWFDRKRVVFLTYMKNAPDYPDDKFARCITIQFKTELVKYELFATYHAITGYHKKVKTLAIRDPKTGRKAVIITNCDRVLFQGRHIRPRDETLVGYMLNRWGQENFFKRAVNEVNIDHHFGYQISSSSPQPMIDNPEIKELKKILTKTKKDLEKTQSQIASFILKQNKSLSLEVLARTETKLAQLLQERLRLVGQTNSCQAQIDALPEKVSYTDAFPEKPRKECSLHKKDLLDTLKVAAFLILLLMEEKLRWCHRNQRTLVPTLDKLLRQPTNLNFLEEKCLVQLHPFYFASNQDSARTFCHNLNLEKAVHPISGLPLYFEIKGP